MNNMDNNTYPRHATSLEQPGAPVKPKLNRLTNDNLSHNVEYVKFRTYWRLYYNNHPLLELMDSLSLMEKTEVYEFLMNLTNHAHALEYDYYIYIDDTDTFDTLLNSRYAHIIKAFNIVSSTGNVYLDRTMTNNIPAHFVFSWSSNSLDMILFNKYFDKLL